KRVICYMTRRERCESTTTGVSKGVSGQGSARRTPSAEAASGASMTTSRRVQARMQGQQKYKSPREGALLLLRLQLAERVGFEPTNTCEDVTGIPVQRLRPLGHLSSKARRLHGGTVSWQTGQAPPCGGMPSREGCLDTP